MQFKKKSGSNKIQVIAYVGYDKDKKRSVTTMLGSLDAYTLEPSEGLIDSLTDEQKKELQAYIDKVRQEEQKEVRRRSVEWCASSISRASDSLAALSEADQLPLGVNQAWADGVYGAIDQLQKQLRKLGYTRPKRQPAKPKPDEDQGSLL